MADFTACIPAKEYDDTKNKLVGFVTNHVKCSRPICLVTSGGTAADLELVAVRSIENFSTGLRGAIAVEQLLEKGYAVIHLWRQGSASPFARVLSQHIGQDQANHGLDCDSLGRLFANSDTETDDEMVRQVLLQDADQWMSNSEKYSSLSSTMKNVDEVSLNRSVQYSSRIRKALKLRSQASRERSLLTISFRTVEDYLGKLELCSETIYMTHSLSMILLAAAVSDFYIPKNERSEHKIQSGDGIVLTLKPVPKVLEILRTQWSPNSFIVSFKLETDINILRQKAENAVSKYGCNLVIGNMLQSRHEKVWILNPSDQHEIKPSTATDWSFTEICKPRRSNDPDALEHALIDFVVRCHFDFISQHFPMTRINLQTIEKIRSNLDKKEVKVSTITLDWTKISSVLMEVTGTFIACILTYYVNSTIQRQFRRST